MKQKMSSFVFERNYISATTIHILFPNLPLDQLTDHDGKYDPIEALDLAEALGLRRKSEPEMAEVFDDGETDD